MGDPTYFSVVGGANPHTRTRFGSRRRVDRELAIRQWAKLRDLLRDLGVHIVIVPADEKQPGLVYPANAGFMLDVDAPSRAQDKLFHLANLLPTRAGEIPWYRQALKEVGIATRSFDARFRHEGEADFFPAGDVYLASRSSASSRLSRSRPGSASTAFAATCAPSTCSCRWSHRSAS
jgi:N-dimethylarginine dimethylaminohydrolase